MFKQISDSCIKCGKCIPTCTIHSVNQDEVTSPRGFLDLLGAYKRGDLELDKNAKNIFESCFLCTNCVEICPNSLPVDTMIENIRFELAKKFGISWWKKLAFWLLRHRFILDISAKFGYVFQTCGFKKQNDSMRARVSIPMIKKGRLLPSLRKTTFLNSNADFIDNGGEFSIGIFIGCLANYSYTNIGFSLLEILKELKINVNLMKKQKCCGAPSYFTGDFKSVEILAKFNIEYFEQILKTCKAIIIPEATCSAMIRVDYEHFFKDESWRKRAKELSKKVYLATDFLANHTNLAQKLAQKPKQNLSVTYHDPCHARKMQGIFKEPRMLLKQNYNIIEMSNSNACCGFGGVTIQTQKYHLAQNVGQKKAEMIDLTNANFISAECSACKMQISNSLVQNDSKVDFQNPLELIAKALK